MKHVAGVLIAVVGIFALAGCGQGPTSEPDSDTATAAASGLIAAADIRTPDMGGLDGGGAAIVSC